MTQGPEAQRRGPHILATPYQKRKCETTSIHHCIFTINCVQKSDNPSIGVCWNSNQKDLQGDGLEYNFNLVKNRFGATAHVRELESTDYPYRQLMQLFVKMDYDGWILLEARSKPKDRVEALAKQAILFKQMVAEAQAHIRSANEA